MIVPLLFAACVATEPPPDRVSLEVVQRRAAWVAQRRTACGVRSVALCLRETGRADAADHVTRQCPIGPAGVAVGDLMTAIHQTGAYARLVHIEPTQLRDLPAPAVLVVTTQSHCVAYLGVEPGTDGARIFEPSTGEIRRVSLAAIRRDWQGDAIVFDRGSPSPGRWFAAAAMAAAGVPLLAWCFRLRRAKSPEPTQPRPAFTLVELLVVVAILGVLVSLVMSAVQRGRTAAARAACLDRVRQCALATHAHHAERGYFPAGCTPRLGDPFRHASWRIALLPYLEHEALWHQARAAFHAAPADFLLPPHDAVYSTPVAAFVCPADDRAAGWHETRAYLTPSQGTPVRIAHSSYLGVAGTTSTAGDGLMYADSHSRLDAIPDGASQTLLLGERPPSDDGRVSWWYAGIGLDGRGGMEHFLGVREVRPPRTFRFRFCTPGLFLYTGHPAPGGCEAFAFRGSHPGGAAFAFADGSAPVLAYSADRVLPALATREGGEALNDWE